MLVNETNYTSKNKCSVQGYKVFREDRIPKSNANPGGGISIFVKSDLPSVEKKYQKSSNELQVIGVKN